MSRVLRTGHHADSDRARAAESRAALRQLALQLGLHVAATRRHHGLFGGSPRHRRRVLRHLAYNIRANEVFVRLAAVAWTARSRGADEALEEWRSAAA